MKNQPQPSSGANALPSFLDSQTGDGSEVDPAEAPVAVAEAEPVEAGTEEQAVDEVGPEEPAAAASETPAAAPTPRRRQGAPPARAGGVLALSLGMMALLGSPAAAFMPELATYGCTPNLLFVLGALLVGTGMTQRHVLRLQHRLDEAESRRRQDADAVQQNLQLLVDDSVRGKAPAQGEELQHVLMALQRQDEKVNNLTKAIKMYGKPLMEIAEQGTEAATTLASVKALVEGASDTSRHGLQRLETQLKGVGHGKELHDLQTQLQQLATRIDALGQKTPTISLEPVQQHLGRIEVSLAAVAQRLEDSELRKSLLRLEESVQKGREATQQLLRGDSVTEATKTLQARIESATKGLADGLAQLRDGNLGGLESAVRDIQREMSGVATTVAQINAAVKGGVRVATAAPAPAAATPAAAPATAAATPAVAGSAAPAPAAAAPAAEGSAYATGARNSASKNVLGAIAKLKQMKG